MDKVKVKMHENCHDLIPIKNHSTDSGFDLKARCVKSYDYDTEEMVEIDITDESFKLKPGRRVLVPSGIYLELQSGYEAQVRSRSGLALKQSIFVLNSPGTVDAQYRGEVGVILMNTSRFTSFEIKRGARIAQLVIQRVPELEFEVVDEINDTDRGAKGFGSSGV